jgi:hypothetical protein
MYYYAKEYHRLHGVAPSDSIIRDTIIANHDYSLSDKQELNDILRSMAQLSAIPGDVPHLLNELKAEWADGKFRIAINSAISANKEQSSLEAIVLAHRQMTDLMNLVSTEIGRPTHKPMTAAQVADLYESKFFSDEGLAPVNLYYGLECLDNTLRGMQRGESVAIIGASNVGKSFLAAKFAYTNIFRHNKKGVIASLEMSEDEIQARMLSYMTGISSRRLRNGYKGTTTQEQELVKKAYKQLRDMQDQVLFVGRGMFTTIKELERHIIDWNGRDLSQVHFNCMDYLDKLQPSGRQKTMTKHERVALVSSEATDFSANTGITLITPSQSSAEFLRGKGEVGAGSGAYVSVYQDFDTILLLEAIADEPFIAATQDTSARPAGLYMHVTKTKTDNTTLGQVPYKLLIDFSTARITDVGPHQVRPDRFAPTNKKNQKEL